MTEFTPMPLPEIGVEQIALVERLSNATAVSGDEGEVRKIVLEQVQPLADECKVDALGNVLAVKKARVDNPLRVMLAAHMDEIGFMIVQDDDNGLFQFQLVGGIDIRQLPGKSVLVGKKHIPGVIGAKPIHLQESDETVRPIPLDTLRIDVGPENGKKVKPGDRATFATQFHQVGPSLVGKAMDDRLGVAILIELLKHAPVNIEMLLAFTVQEEVGLRGARVAGYAFNPDLAIVVDSTPAMDMPMWDDSENTRYNTRLDAGPAIYIADSSTLADPRLVNHLAKTGDQFGIPYQFRQPGGGGTDAGAIHTRRAGVPSISVSVPGRYAHTAVMMCRLNDWLHTLQLVHASMQMLTPALLAEPR